MVLSCPELIYALANRQGRRGFRGGRKSLISMGRNKIGTLPVALTGLFTCLSPKEPRGILKSLSPKVFAGMLQVSGGGADTARGRSAE